MDVTLPTYVPEATVEAEKDMGSERERNSCYALWKRNAARKAGQSSVGLSMRRRKRKECRARRERERETDYARAYAIWYALGRR